ncbi:MAG TPA: lysylphosphatidylglycerol synthase transmembrane domain-containing protein [Anaerolineaceae bacterium]|nr:lysylphosphatidylglycerol synthase transmembrane domain-containing protein [Anaerolineaceae bacterium]HPS33059.1 lysylphosphatidylglycerol synthase transmembrane domain-containing protein [Anaerolineaceae bacterium]
MKKDTKINWNLIIRWAGTLLSIGILIYLFRQIGAEETWAAVQKISGRRIAEVLVLVFVSRLATWGRWHTLLQVQALRVRWQDSLRLTFAGLFASNVLPTTIGGDVVRLAGAVRLGIDAALAAASLVADRLVGMTGMALALPFAIPALSSYLKAQASSGAAQTTGAAALFPAFFRKIQQAIKKVFSNFRFWLKHPLILAQALGFTFIHMLATFLIVQILVQGMGESISFTKTAGLWSLTYFISLIPVSINGLGLQELTITNLFSALGGLQPSTSISLAVILRVVWMIGSLPGAFFIGGILGGKRPSEAGGEKQNGNTQD